MTFFFALETPPSGGDTLFVSLTEAYDRVSSGNWTAESGLRF